MTVRPLVVALRFDRNTSSWTVTPSFPPAKWLFGVTRPYIVAILLFLNVPYVRPTDTASLSLTTGAFVLDSFASGSSVTFSADSISGSVEDSTVVST